MTCGNICKDGEKFGPYVGKNRYSDGWKRCKHCYRSALTDKKTCPCCGRKLKSGPMKRTDGRMDRKYMD